MKSNQPSVTVTGIVTALATGTARAADAAAAGLAEKLKSKNDQERAAAIRDAAQAGASAVVPVAALLESSETEHIRAAKRALGNIVHHSGRPAATREAVQVEAELRKALGRYLKPNARREILWLMSEIAGDESVKPIADLLTNVELREDARMVLERMPTAKALEALQKAYATAPADFRNNLAESLLKRGVAVPNFKSERLKPVKPTEVKPPQAS